MLNSTQDIYAYNRAALINYFASGCKRADECRKLGVEVEHFIVMFDGSPVSYEPREGHLGVKDVLEFLKSSYPHASYTTAGDLIGLSASDGSITLEPAGQLELSIAAYESIQDIQAAFERFYALVDPYLASKGAHIVQGGYHPTRKALDLKLIPKKRYRFMDAYFREIKSHGERMMRASASLQVSIDFSDEADAVRKMRIAQAITPVLAAISDDTTVFEGAPNTTPLRRLELWREVDPRRCGVIPHLFEVGFGFGAYADWILGSSPIFVTRAHAADPTGPDSWAATYTSTQDAYSDAKMSIEDIEHVVSMFWPDVRLKRVVEIRPADSLCQEQALGYSALIKGLFYSKASLDAIEGVLGVNRSSTKEDVWPLRSDDVETAIISIQRHGYDGIVYGKRLWWWIKFLFDAAQKALPADERSLLASLEQFATHKPWWQTPSSHIA